MVDRGTAPLSGGHRASVPAPGPPSQSPAVERHGRFTRLDVTVYIRIRRADSESRLCPMVILEQCRADRGLWAPARHPVTARRDRAGPDSESVTDSVIGPRCSRMLSLPSLPGPGPGTVNSLPTVGTSVPGRASSSFHPAAPARRPHKIKPG